MLFIEIKSTARFIKNNSGTKSTLPGTRYTVGQFRDCPGESWTVGYPTEHVIDLWEVVLSYNTE